MPTDLDQIYALNAEYALAVDGNEADRWANCFTPDGVFSSPMAEPVEGAESLRGFCREYHVYLDGAQPRHVITTISVEVAGDDSAHGSAYLTLYHTKDKATQIIAVGRYQDLYRRHRGAWRFARRDAFFD